MVNRPGPASVSPAEPPEGVEGRQIARVFIRAALRNGATPDEITAELEALIEEDEANGR